MFTPRLTSFFLKTAPAFLLGLVLVVASANVHVSRAIAQPVKSDHGSLVRSVVSRLFGSFRQPDPKRPSGPTTVTGSRGGRCLGAAQPTFTTLGPDETIGLTASNRPEFVWYLPASDIAYPVTFRLLVLNTEKDFTLVHTEDLAYTSGFTKYSLPAKVADLSPDKEYRWQVVVQCNPAHPARSLVQELSFEVVSPSASLLRSLNAATTDADRALAYGQAGFWYDAIAQVAQSVSSQDKAVRQSLLEDLANTATEDEQIKEDILRISEVNS